MTPLVRIETPRQDPAGWPGQLRFWTHDLLNSACGVRELLDLLARDGESREMRAMLDLAVARLIEELRALHLIVRNGEGFAARLDEIGVGDLLRAVRAASIGLAGLAERHLRIAEAPPGGLVTDAGLLQRALVNLVRNAIEASAPGDTVSLTTTWDATTIRFAVRNPGQMPPYLDPTRPAVSGKGDGHGLGLHGVSSVVQHYLAGELQLASDPALGTTCTIVLPRRRRAGVDG